MAMAETPALTFISLENDSCQSEAKMNNIEKEKEKEKKEKDDSVCDHHPSSELQSFKIIKHLGKGASGNVYQVEDVVTHINYAMKTLSKRDRGSLISYYTERMILSLTLTCTEYVIKMYSSFEDEDHYYIVTE